MSTDVTPEPTPDRTSEAVTSALTDYEHRRLAEVRDWYRRRPGAADRVIAGASERARATVGYVLDSDRGQRALQRGVDRVLEEFDRRVLREIVEARPLAGVDRPEAPRRAAALRRADERADELNVRYVGLISGQAAVAGAASLSLPLAVVAMAADVAGAVLGSLRAAGHTLLVYGVDPDHPSLLPATVSVVAAASETDGEVRRATIRDTIACLTSDGTTSIPEERLARVVAQQAGSRTVRETVEQALRRALQRRAVRVVPILGGIASGAASAWLASRVTEGAGHAGTVAFLHRHGGVPVDAALGVVPLV